MSTQNTFHHYQPLTSRSPGVSPARTPCCWGWPAPSRCCCSPRRGRSPPPWTRTHQTCVSGQNTCPRRQNEYKLGVILFRSSRELCLSLLSFWNGGVPFLLLKVFLQLWLLEVEHLLQRALENIAAESSGWRRLAFVWVVHNNIRINLSIYWWCLLLVIPCYKLYSGPGLDWLTLNNYTFFVWPIYSKLTFGIWGR